MSVNEFQLQKKLSYKGKSWQELLDNSLINIEDLNPFFNKFFKESDNYNYLNDIKMVIKKYPMKINNYYLSLIQKINGPIWKQVIPDILELSQTSDSYDPLNEENQSPVPDLIHRYPDRVVFLISNACAVYCRFCMRKRKVGNYKKENDKYIESGISYISKNKAVKEVILSGGDPLILSDEKIDYILKQLKTIKHVEIIRIHSRIPCALPQRITTYLVNILKQYHPIYINIHFNHPDEITNQSIYACKLLADAGIPLGSQTVLLKNVNDNEDIIKKLMQKLLSIRVKPYYLHHPDLVRGTKHFRVSPEKGLKILHSMRGHISGMCIPNYMIDLPEGEGKIPIIPDYIKHKDTNIWQIEAYKGNRINYPIDNIE